MIRWIGLPVRNRVCILGPRNYCSKIPVPFLSIVTPSHIPFPVLTLPLRSPAIVARVRQSFRPHLLLPYLYSFFNNY